MQRQAKTHIHTHQHTPRTHTHFITSEPLWNWESLLEFIFLGSRKTWFISWGLQQIDIDEDTSRSTRLNVDSHFWMLEDWILSKIKVVGLEDWTFGSRGYSYWTMILEHALVRTLVHLDGDSGDCWSCLYRLTNVLFIKKYPRCGRGGGCSTHNLMEQLQNEKLNHTPSFDTGDKNIWFDIWITGTAHPINNGVVEPQFNRTTHPTNSGVFDPQFNGATPKWGVEPYA